MRSPRRTPKLSIVVPVLDEAERIGAALAPLQPFRDAGHELVVVDGGSRDGTFAAAAPLADRVLLAPRGRAVQMNVGAAVATGDVLLFLHADCRLPVHADAAIARALSRGRTWGRFDVTLDGSSRTLPMVASFMNVRSAATGICTGDQAIFVERATFAAFGGFPALPLMEDIAISLTLKRLAGPPARLTEHVVVSGRRWDANGAWPTIRSMWALRWAYWRGADPRELAKRYYGVEPRDPPTLQVFAKAPVPGRVKTRLARTIGDDAAAAAYRALAERTLATAETAGRAGVVGAVELWLDPESDPAAIAPWRERYGVTIETQAGDDLGARMHHALRTSIARGHSALLIGTDVPGYDVAYLARAAAELERHDAVIGPADDGGYVLIGLARDIDVFRGVPWSTPDVMTATRARLAAARASHAELPPLWDVDTHDDFLRWCDRPVTEVAP
jgi:rSAM/selenodomain-associated transferase 2/rSAM/selenodomain-associated transferase 1